MKKQFLSVSLIAALTLGTAGATTALAAPHSSPVLSAPSSDKQVIKRIDADKIYKNIEYLSQTPRVAGTDSEYNAVQFIKKQFKSYGYKADIEEFNFLSYTDPNLVELSVAGFDGEIQANHLTYSVNGNLSGEVVYAGLGTKEELEETDVAGKIALIQRGSLTFAEKVLNAAEKGAAGVILFNNADGELNGTLGEDNDKYIPSVTITKKDGEALLEKLNAGAKLTASLKIEGAYSGEKTSYNVVATKKATKNNKAKKSDIIYITGHHDSVAGAPGANDDASGTSVTLELARVLKNLPTDTEIRFVTFGAEENGLLGSQHYVTNLSDDDDIKRTIANFNLDMVGSKDAGDLVILTNDGEMNLVTELAQASSTRLNGEPTPYGQGGRSDHVSFAEAGIPAALFIHSPSEPWYHTPDDTIDKISKEKLQDVAEIVGTAVYDQAKIEAKKPDPTHKKGKKVKVPHLFEKEFR
ncbi:M28 family peptidase [Peribacillus simplex]|uniref:M28 family peptidase n=2 Tax=Peribacillus TaxID=2675229 RepID=A0AA90SZR7_9BACI|nr:MULTISPECIES: M28 family peptidase [Peribacillus]MDP1417569.1 M28 family peptidase [Peribacillus simplex]MDP1450224.1 M28 family peptidase [Peribacillus frigoritolerans]